ncbi:hypothetical protein QOT17_013826 [Balamuthia mandrillaris]
MASLTGSITFAKSAFSPYPPFASSSHFSLHASNALLLFFLSSLFSLAALLSSLFSNRAHFEALPPLSQSFLAAADPSCSSDPPASTELLSELSNKNAFEVGARLFQEGQLGEAIEALKVEALRHPMNHKAWAMLAKAHEENDCDNLSMACNCTAVRIEPSNRDVLLNIVAGCINESQTYLTGYFLVLWLLHSPYKARLGNLEPSNIPLQDDIPFNITDELYFDMEQAFKDIIKEHPDDVEVRVILAMMEMGSWNYAGAIPHLEHAVKHDPTNHALWHKLGATRANAQLLLDACHAYQEALHLRPKYVRCMSNLAKAHVKLKSPRTAGAWCTSALLINPEAKWVWEYISMIAILYSKDSTEQAALQLAIKQRDVACLQKHFLEGENAPPPIIPPTHVQLAN